jgi:hypothetical protein
MSTPTRRGAELLLAGVIGGAIAGVGVWKLAPAKPAEVTGDKIGAEDRPVAPAAVHDTESQMSPDARIARLEDHVRRLQKELASQSKMSAEEGDTQAAEDGGAQKVTLNAADPRFQQAVRAVINQSELERDEIEKDKRSEQRETWIAKQVDRMSERLGLSEAQATEVEQLLIDQFDQFRALREAEDRPSSPKEWRERMEVIRAETKKKMAEVLSAGQLADYDKMLEEDGWNGTFR